MEIVFVILAAFGVTGGMLRTLGFFAERAERNPVVNTAEDEEAWSTIPIDSTTKNELDDEPPSNYMVHELRFGWKRENR